MKKMLIVAVVAVAGFAYCKGNGGSESADTRTYQRFMKLLRSTDIKGAEELAVEEAARDIKAFTRREADRYRVRGSMTVHRAVYTVEDRVRDGDVVDLEILEELRVDPPGTTSAMGVANVWLRHYVQMQKVDGGWRVVGFEYEFEDAEGMDGIDVDNAHRWF